LYIVYAGASVTVTVAIYMYIGAYYMNCCSVMNEKDERCARNSMCVGLCSL